MGDDAQIIFGAGSEPRLTGEIQVTVIATGFDRAVTGEPVVERGTSQVLPFTPRRTVAAAPAPAPAATPAPAVPTRPVAQPFVRRAPAPGRPATPDVSDLEIPTFIRRQMD